MSRILNNYKFQIKLTISTCHFLHVSYTYYLLIKWLYTVCKIQIPGIRQPNNSIGKLLSPHSQNQLNLKPSD